MIDISFQGATLAINCPLLGGDGRGNIVLEFSEEGTPVDFPDLETVGYAMTMNGELVTWTKPAPITFRLTVIPGSASDGKLRKLLYAGHVGGRRGHAIDQASVIISSATLTVPSIYTAGEINSTANAAGKMTFEFKNGRLTGGNPAIGSNAEGKMTARTYNFVFESIAQSNS